MSQAFDVAVLGATGLVGKTMIEILEAVALLAFIA